MTIELTDLMEKMKPQPLALILGGSTYTVADLTIEQVNQLGNFSDFNDLDGLTFIESLFSGKAPPQFAHLRASLEAGDSENFADRQRHTKAVSLIIATIVKHCEQIQNSDAFKGAYEAVQERVRGQGAGTGEGETAE